MAHQRHGAEGLTGLALAGKGRHQDRVGVSVDHCDRWLFKDKTQAIEM